MYNVKFDAFVWAQIQASSYNVKPKLSPRVFQTVDPNCSRFWEV